MKATTHPHLIRGLLCALVMTVLCASGFRVSADQTAPPAQPSLRGGPPAVLRRDPNPSTFRVLAPRRFSLLAAQRATISVTYLPGGTQNAFGDDCYAWPTRAQAAFDYAASIWASLIQSSVPIEINACWTELSPDILGHASAATYHLHTSSRTYYPAALANALSGSDLNDGDGYDDDADGQDRDADMIVAYNRNFDWYFQTDGQTPNDKVDFVSVVLHEICHGLGFSGAMWFDDGDPQNGVECSGAAGVGCWGVYTSDPARYDRFTENGSGQALVSFPNYSAALGSQLTSDNLYFNGPRANAANGGSPPRLYAPSSWTPGSSYSHLDEIYNHTPNALMTYALADGESNHAPGPVTIGILEDLGWELPQAPPELSLSMNLVGKSDPAPGDAVSFLISVANSGGPATSVVVTNLLPSDVLTPTWSVSPSLAGTTARAGTPFVWDLPDLAANTSGTITVLGTINPSLPGDYTLVNTASISTAEQETDPSNNSGAVIVGGQRTFLPLLLRNVQ